jgi:sulfate adenylyltransferase
MKMGHLIAPHGGMPIDLIAATDRAAELREASRDWPSLDLTDRQISDLELLLSGGFAPLTGFLGMADYESVCGAMRLGDGTLWPIPVTLDVNSQLADTLSKGSRLALRDQEGVMLASVEVTDIWQPDLSAEAERIFGSTDPEHPGVAHLLGRTNPVYVGGRVEGVQLPVHYDFTELRMTPTDVRAEFTRRGWTRVLAFQTRNPMHRAEVELTLRTADEQKANLLIHAVVGETKPGDVDHYTRVRCYQAVLERYPQFSATLALLPLAMRGDGPRETLWHAIISKNHGCTHLIVGPFHDAQDLLKNHEDELGVALVDPKSVVYVPDQDRYLAEDELPTGAKTVSISDVDLFERLRNGREIPEWFTYPEVVRELRRTHPPRSEQGFTVFFTGLSGSGKSTIANALLVKLLQMGSKPVTFLDGDLVRRHLSSELGFSRQHRDLNIRRIGFVAAEITKHGGIAICAPIAPYDSTRKEVRSMVEASGGFLLVHVATPIDICEERDRKGLYAKARAGMIPEFTGVSDPYEEPFDAEMTIDTTAISPEEAANQIIRRLESEGYLTAG